MAAKVLLVGSGAREHALSWKLTQSADVSHVFVSPGNAGTAKLGPKVSNLALNLHDHSAIVDWCHDSGVSLVIVGPEDPLADGIADNLTKAGISCFGPTAAAAKIESSKEFAKDLMTKNGIPTARWASFTDCQHACQFIESADFPALVVKASGLAAGKGVIVASSKEEAIKAVKEILQDSVFGEAGSTVVVEELLAGEEISCLAFCDGKSVVCMPPAQDHKRLLDDDKGPNTGGMGAYCPCTLISEAEMNFVKKDIIQKTVDALREAGSPFVGVLYAGVMLTKDGPKVLEFNCRFGDPEAQVLIPLLQTDLYQVISHCVRGDLSSVNVEFDVSSTAVGVVLASSGYPGSFPKGLPITGLESAETDFGVQVFYAGATSSGDAILTSGGRVLTIVSKSSSLALASQKAQLAAERVNFDGKQFRKDIGHKAFKRDIPSQASLTYKDSGVDIEAGDALVESIKGLAAATARPGCCPKLGLFGGLFDLSAIGCPGRLLVIGTDGVGTKLKIAQAINIHNTVGIDLVAMSVNDILCQGAESLCFSDDFSCSRLSVEVARSVIEGISIGCQQAGCALIGGETAELPDTFKDGEYHLSGSAVGYVKQHLLLPKFDDVKSGDVVLGLASSGLHSNGFSLVRKIVERCGLSYDVTCPFDTTKTLGQYLLTPTKIYVKNLMPVLGMENRVKALAHITGGGLPGNAERVLPKNTRVVIDANQWVVPPVFGWIAEKGNVETSEMLRTFNCGLGMVIIVSEECATEVQQLISQSGEEAHRIGRVVPRLPGEDPVEVRNVKEAFEKSYGVYRLKSDSVVVTCCSARKKALPVKKRVAVLLSGSGTNLQALIDFTKNPSNESSAEIALVISNVPSAFGLTRAANAGIASEVVNHKDFKTREEFDEAVHQVLVKKNIDIVCLAGFMRILSGGFVRKWKGKMLNTHPSLLPSFKGAHAVREALKAGVRKTGCSIHFVAEEVDAGAIIEQEAVAVNPGDTEDIVTERIKAVEHSAYPNALEMVASGKVMLTDDNRTKWL